MYVQNQKIRKTNNLKVFNGRVLFYELKMILCPIKPKKSYLRFLCLLVYNDVIHILWFFFSSLLPVSQDYPFVIVRSVFSTRLFKILTDIL